MITREIKVKILERYNEKDEKMYISNILDKVYRFEKTNKIEFTNFLNLNEFSKITSILNELKVKYFVYSLNNKLSKKVIFFVPDYIVLDESFFKNYISAIKITSSNKDKLYHKDYMGAIFSLGLKHEVIGDIYVKDNFAILFCLRDVKDYILTNLFKVKRQEVNVEEIKIDENLESMLEINLVKYEYIVSSLRADAVISVVYGLSRNQVKEKILSGDLYINDKQEYFSSTMLKEGDIVSFRKCGKLKIGEKLRKTRSDRIVLEVYKYS